MVYDIKHFMKAVSQGLLQMIMLIYIQAGFGDTCPF